MPSFTATPWQYIYRSGRYKVQQCNSFTPLAEIATVGDPEMSAANARLMAASPEMYRALEECIAALHGAIEVCGDIGNLGHAKKLAEDAMQKATFSTPANDHPWPSWNPYGETDCQ